MKQFDLSVLILFLFTLSEHLNISLLPPYYKKNNKEFFRLLNKNTKNLKIV